MGRNHRLLYQKPSPSRQWRSLCWSGTQKSYCPQSGCRSLSRARMDGTFFYLKNSFCLWLETWSSGLKQGFYRRTHENKRKFWLWNLRTSRSGTQWISQNSTKQRRYEIDSTDVPTKTWGLGTHIQTSVIPACLWVWCWIFYALSLSKKAQLTSNFIIWGVQQQNDWNYLIGRSSICG